MLNKGAAKQAVKAVSPMPSLDIARFPQKSPALLLQASNVIPKSEDGSFITIPKSDNNSTIISQTVQIQSIDIMKPIRVIQKLYSGGLLYLHVHQIKKLTGNDRVNRNTGSGIAPHSTVNN